MSELTLWRRLRSSTLAANTLWMLGGNGARFPLQLVYFALIARALGADGYGVFASAAALAAIVSPFAAWGGGDLLVQHVSRAPTLFRSYWGSALLTVVGVGLALTALVVVASIWVLPAEVPRTLVALVTLADLVFFNAIGISGQAYQAFDRLRRMAELYTLASLLRLAAIVGLSAAATRAVTPLAWAWAYAASTAACAVFSVLVASRDFGAPRAWLALRERSTGFAFAVGLSSQNIYNDVDKTMLAKLSTVEVAGSYAAAYRVVQIALVPIYSLLNAAYPSFFRHGSTGMGGALRMTRKLAAPIVVLGVVGAAVLFFGAPVVPAILGHDYADSVGIVRWLALLPLTSALHRLGADTLTGSGHQHVRSGLQLTVAVANAGANLVLIPRYAWKGAVFATLGSEVALVVLFLLYILAGRRR